MNTLRLVLFLSAIMLVGALAFPAYAETTISGTIPFDPANTNGVKSVTDLTIYALGPNGVQKTTPNADGTYSITVAGNGTYSLKVAPSRLDYVNKTTNVSYSILYPDGATNVLPLIVPDTGLKGIAIPAFYVSYPTISGTISFDPNNFNNVKSVTDLTIYAANTSGFSTSTSPNADGTFSLSVVGNGTYSFRVIPSKLDYYNNSSGQPYSIQYPDAETNKFTQTVPDEGLKGIAIPANVVTQTEAIPSSEPTLSPPTATPKSTPGFTVIAVLAALGATAAIAYRKR